MARVVTPIMQRRGRGAFVNVSAQAVFEREASFPTPGVFRAGMAACTKLWPDQ